MKHTPGPWHVRLDDTGGPFTGWPSVDAAEELDCTIVHRAGFKQEFWGELSQREAIANARLIAAAPDLLAIAEGVLGMLQNCSVTSGVCCCGEEIDRHSRAMDCGHTPVDSGAYYAKALFEDVTAAITKATGE